MITNSEAINALSKATFALYDAYGAAKDAQKTKILRLIHILNREYYALLGLDPHNEDKGYSALTQEFKSSTALVDQVRQDAEHFISSVKVAAAVVSTLGEVATLLA